MYSSSRVVPRTRTARKSILALYVWRLTSRTIYSGKWFRQKKVQRTSVILHTGWWESCLRRRICPCLMWLFYAPAARSNLLGSEQRLILISLLYYPMTPSQSRLHHDLRVAPGPPQDHPLSLTWPKLPVWQATRAACWRKCSHVRGPSKNSDDQSPWGIQWATTHHHRRLFAHGCSLVTSGEHVLNHIYTLLYRTIRDLTQEAADHYIYSTVQFQNLGKHSFSILISSVIVRGLENLLRRPQQNLLWLTHSTVAGWNFRSFPGLALLLLAG